MIDLILRTLVICGLIVFIAFVGVITFVCLREIVREYDSDKHRKRRSQKRGFDDDNE